MSDSSEIDREGMRRWLENWQRVGPLLEAEKWERLADLTDEQARAMTRAVMALWRPAVLDNLGTELVEQQRWFMAAARARRER